ncbi:hypothetical protein PVL29_008975 [Vitis rotundifolia]|uniref:Uncharacterized protein n=1 Tax=Vitis rotundifolia TaxID=103349 RepID=A0AA38ZZ84_VITRO|nr:hypothetical protein PVL29_008975 [Vitis rotundifolia]
MNASMDFVSRMESAFLSAGLDPRSCLQMKKLLLFGKEHQMKTNLCTPLTLVRMMPVLARIL